MIEPHSIGTATFCYICDRSMDTSDELLTHINTHKDDEFFECPDCADVFLKLALFKEHVEQHAVPLSNKAFTSSKLSLKEDVQVDKESCMKMYVDHSNPRNPVYNKPNAVIQFYDKSTHIKVNSSKNFSKTQQSKVDVKRKIEPEMCREFYGNSSERINVNIDANDQNISTNENENMLASHEDADETSQNINRNNIINVEDIWDDEESDVHNLPLPLPTDPFNNGMGGDKFISYQNNPERYRNCKNNFKNLSCNICSKIFKHSYSLQIHLKRHANRKNVQCEYCGREFFNRGGLKIHMLTHTGDRPYHCKVCSKNFRSISNLTEHERTHIGLKEICYVCGNLFANNYGLRRHLKLHIEEKPFKCKICEGRFRQKKHLENHLIVHTKEKNFACDICGNRFGRKDVMEAHKKLRCIGVVKKN